MAKIDVQCESCGRDFFAQNLNGRQCPECKAKGAPVVQDLVSTLSVASNQFIYDLKSEATLKLRTLKGDREELWRTVKACDRILVARELPLMQPDTLTRIRNMTQRKLVSHEFRDSKNI